MLVLGIETSCDETGVALYDSDQGLIAHKLYSQIKLHTKFGGVVPELASRDHARKTLILINEMLAEAKVTLNDIDAIAYTIGPGLVGALLVGAMLGRTVAYALNIPAIGVHHMEAHLLAPMLDEERLAYPFLALLVSGGHSLLVRVDAFSKYTILGESLDDAAGEAFDKVAKMLELPYPGGPEVAKLAKKGTKGRFHFPRPMTEKPGLDFSFSGLKTFTLNTLQKFGADEQTKADIALAFQDAITDTLRIKCKRALKQTNIKRLIVAGGVGANQQLRDRLNSLAKAENIEVFYPRLAFCTDNGAMIAYAGCQRILMGECANLAISVYPRWSLHELL